MFEACREGPKALVSTTKFFKIRKNQLAEGALREDFFRISEIRFLALHKESTIPKWSRCYNPIIYRIT
jgi:hypothetical protein